ncbi:hypothetical protein OK016_01125 [Vibrio chagasii]|nr:hypothetical protein [Vibrio chagasii]
MTQVGAFCIQARVYQVGTSVTSNEAEINAGALDNVLFRPAQLPNGNEDTTGTGGEYQSGTITDTATFLHDARLPLERQPILIRSPTPVRSFEVVPVVDDVCNRVVQ